MIYVTSIKDFKKNPKKGKDGAFLITRNLVKLKSRGDSVLTMAEPLTLLAPSIELSYAKKGWVRRGIWNEEIYKKIYRPYFKIQLMQNGLAQACLKKLAEESKYQDIALLCSCEDINLCHRAIIGEAIAEKGGLVDIK